MSPLITIWSTGFSFLGSLNIELKVEVRRVFDAYEVGFISGGMCTSCNPTIEHLCGEQNLSFYENAWHITIKVRVQSVVQSSGRVWSLIPGSSCSSLQSLAPIA